jgi:adenosylhomocysteine nucleosidase
LLAVVVAFREEVKDYLKKGEFRAVDRGDTARFYVSTVKPEVVVVEGAIGRRRAQDATRELIERYEPEFILSAGFAGGVKAGLTPGDLFIGGSLLSIEGPPVFWGAASVAEQTVREEPFLNALIGVPAGEGQVARICGCLSVPQIVSSSSMKTWIGNTFPVSIIDMESFWVCQTAAESGIPHAVVRSVLDPMEQTLPSTVSRVVNDGRRPWARIAKSLITTPTELPKLIHLAWQVGVARASLGEFLAKLVPAKLPSSQASGG